MTIFSPNIPLPGDDPSDSQSEILQNFQTLNSAYGTMGDHYSWDNTEATETRRHAKVTLPGLPTINAPGNVLPVTTSADMAIFAQTRNSQTTPFVVRNGLVPTAPLANIWPLMPIKAYASFLTLAAAGNITPLDSFNITDPIVQATLPASTYSWTFTIINACRTATYGVLAFISVPSNNIQTQFYTIANANTFTVTIKTNNAFPPIGLATVIVIES
jgi:heptaprenylglyceryl phosphate synthase